MEQFNTDGFSFCQVHIRHGAMIAVNGDWAYCDDFSQGQICGERGGFLSEWLLPFRRIDAGQPNDRPIAIFPHYDGISVRHVCDRCAERMHDSAGLS